MAARALTEPQYRALATIEAGRVRWWGATHFVAVVGRGPRSDVVQRLINMGYVVARKTLRETGVFGDGHDRILATTDVGKRALSEYEAKEVSR
ncbi:MAG TPA: hypothetical protein VGF95_14315 [Solirubrobacteraceae bacterium]|jgi:hypothetical protein